MYASHKIKVYNYCSLSINAKIRTILFIEHTLLLH